MVIAQMPSIGQLKFGDESDDIPKKIYLSCQFLKSVEGFKWIGGLESLAKLLESSVGSRK